MYTSPNKKDQKQIQYGQAWGRQLHEACSNNACNVAHVASH
jgi:hypothetical protein